MVNSATKGNFSVTEKGRPNGRAAPENHQEQLLVLAGNARSRPVKLGDVDGERLIVGPGSVFQYAKRNLLTEQNRKMARAAEVDASVDPVAKRDVVSQL